MAPINLNVHFKYDEVVERLKAEGWVIPVRCEDCKHYKELQAGETPYYVCENAYRYTDTDFFEPPNGDWYCADGEHKGGDE